MDKTYQARQKVLVEEEITQEDFSLKQIIIKRSSRSCKLFWVDGLFLLIIKASDLNCDCNCLLEVSLAKLSIKDKLLNKDFKSKI